MFPGAGEELELELIQPHMAQKPVLQGEVGRAASPPLHGKCAASRLLDSQLWKLEAARRGRRTTS